MFPLHLRFFTTRLQIKDLKGNLNLWPQVLHVRCWPIQTLSLIISERILWFFFLVWMLALKKQPDIYRQHIKDRIPAQINEQLFLLGWIGGGFNSSAIILNRLLGNKSGSPGGVGRRWLGAAPLLHCSEEAGWWILCFHGDEMWSLKSKPPYVGAEEYSSHLDDRITVTLENTSGLNNRNIITNKLLSNST